MTNFLNQTAYAKHRNITQPRVSKMIRDGKIPADCIVKKNGKTLIDKKKADVALEQTLDRKHNPPKETVRKSKRKSPKSTPTAEEMSATVDIAGLENLTMAEAQTLHAQYKAALTKLEYDEKSGVLVNKIDVDAEFFALVRIARDAVLNIPERISAELVVISDIHKMTEKLRAELTQSLENLSQ